MTGKPSICREYIEKGPEHLVVTILNSSNDFVKKLVEECPRRKIKGTFYTIEEVAIGVLYYRKGMSPNQIAEALGMSRSNVYAFIRKLRETAEKARNTVRIYNYLSSYITVKAKKNTGLDEVVENIYREADKMHLRIPYKSLQLAEIIRKHGVVDEENKLTNDIIIEIDLMTNKITIKKIR